MENEHLIFGIFRFRIIINNRTEYAKAVFINFVAMIQGG